MRIAIHTLGTRGDVQPYIALAKGLAARGHEVQIAAPEQYEGLVTQRGLSCAALPGEFLALMETPEGKAALAGGGGFAPGFKLLTHIRPLMRRLLDAEWEAARSFTPDVIVYHPKSIASPHIAQKLSCTAILASPLPGFTPTGAFPSPLLPFSSLGPLNRISHLLAIRGASMLFGKLLREWRGSALKLGASPHIAPLGTLYAYSQSVVPKPEDWGPDVAVTGYWFLDSPDWQMPRELAAFLEDGEPPIYVGFGSMPGLEPERATRLIVEALARTRNRGLIATGGGAVCAISTGSTIRFIDEAPHDRIIPFVKATIQHGGAGTTAASLRAGKPTAICPFFGDQPFWARRIAQLGVGPPPVSRRNLTADALSVAIAAMSAPDIQLGADRMGRAIRAEDGIAEAVQFIEKLASA